VVALTRQIGVLYERVAPAGALLQRHGPEVGSAAPVVEAEELRGRTRTVGGRRDDGRSTLLFFLSPTCPVCKTLLPVLRSIARREADRVEVVLASDGPRPEHEAFVQAERLDGFAYVLSPSLGMTWQVGKLPYAALVDAGGVVRAKGLVNTREHLESLFEAMERGVASIQDYLESRVAQREVAQR
jgi:methylamine dehydrogenase accessory protein MauD